MRFERITLFHRLLGLVIGFVGVVVLRNGNSATALAWAAGLTIGGLILAFARSGNFIDFAAKQVVSYGGWIVPWSRERRPFSSLARVTVEGRRRTQNAVGGIYEFPIELRGEGPDLRLCELRAYARARRLARQLAHRMGLALSDHGVERPSGFVDEPLRDRLLRTGAIPGQETQQGDPSDPYRNVITSRKAPPAPAGTRITVEDGDAETRLEVPGQFGFSVAAGLFIAFSLLVAVPVLAVGEQRFRIAWSIVFSPVALGFLAVWLRSASMHWRVIVDGHTLRVEKRTWLLGRRYTFQLTELDDVHTASAAEPRYHDLTNRLTHRRATGFVVVRSDQRAIPVGVGRSREELDWIVARIQHAIARHSTEARTRV